MVELYDGSMHEQPIEMVRLSNFTFKFGKDMHGWREIKWNEKNFLRKEVIWNENFKNLLEPFEWEKKWKKQKFSSRMCSFGKKTRRRKYVIFNWNLNFSTKVEKIPNQSIITKCKFLSFIYPFCFLDNIDHWLHSILSQFWIIFITD